MPKHVVPASDSQRYETRWLAYAALALLLLNVALRVFLAFQFPLLVEESYCWQCSLVPAFGYAEFPPFVVWMIRANQALIGANSVGSLRLVATLAGTLSYCLIYSLAWQLSRDRRVALWSLIGALALPGLGAAGILVLPDTFLLLFSLAYLNLFVRALNQEHLVYWVVAGVALGLAILCKLSIALVGVASVCYLMLFPDQRRWLYRSGPYVVISIALLVSSPYLAWLAANGADAWACLSQSIRVDDSQFSWWRAGEVLFEQLPVLGPLLVLPTAACLLLGSPRFPAERDGVLFARLHSLVPLAWLLGLGTFVETHPNWTIVAYPTAAIVMAFWIVRGGNEIARRLAKWLLIAQLALMTIVTILAPSAISILHKREKTDLRGPIGAKLVFAQEMLFGWSEVSDYVEQIIATESAKGNDMLVFSDERNTASMLAWHGHAERVINLGGVIPLSPANATSQEQRVDYESIIGCDGLFVTSADWKVKYALSYYFQRVDELPTAELSVGSKQFRIFRVEHLRPRAVTEFSQVERRIKAISTVMTSREYLRVDEISDREFIRQVYEDLFDRTARDTEVNVWISRDGPFDRVSLSRMLTHGGGFWRRLDVRGVTWLDQVLARVVRRQNAG